MSKELHDKILSLPCPATQSQFATRHELNCFKDGHQAAREASAALALAAAAPQVVADERAHEIMNSMAVHVDDWADGLDYEPSKTEVSGKALHYILSRVATPVQAQEPVDWQKIALFYQDLYSKEKHRAPVQPVAVPEAAQQNGGLVRAALIDLLSPEVERAANSGAVSFECQSNIATIFARGRQALAQSSFDAAPAAQGDAKDAERLEFIESGTCDLRCYNDHDGDVYWNVIEHHMAAPIEREIGWGNTARQAIDAAIAAKAAS